MFLGGSYFAIGSRLKFIKIVMIWCAFLAFVVACAPKPDRYVGYEGPSKQLSEVAVLRAVGASIWEIDGERFQHPDPDRYYSEAHLLPGDYQVTAYRWFGVSVLIVPRGYIEVTRRFYLSMEPGHVYELHADRTTGPGFRVFFWVKDATTGAIVAGQVLK